LALPGNTDEISVPRRNNLHPEHLYDNQVYRQTVIRPSTDPRVPPYVVHFIRDKYHNIQTEIHMTTHGNVIHHRNPQHKHDFHQNPTGGNARRGGATYIKWK